MATWSQLQERVRRDYVLDVDSDHEFALTLPRQDGAAARAQRVMVREYEAWGRHMFEIRSAFGELGDFDAESLLTDSLQLPLGAVALHGRFLVLVNKGCLEDITVDGVIFALTHMTLLADVLEERLGKDRF